MIQGRFITDSFSNVLTGDLKGFTCGFTVFWLNSVGTKTNRDGKKSKMSAAVFSISSSCFRPQFVGLMYSSSLGLKVLC